MSSMWKRDCEVERSGRFGGDKGCGRSGRGCGSGDGSCSMSNSVVSLLIVFTLDEAWDDGKVDQFFSAQDGQFGFFASCVFS